MNPIEDDCCDSNSRDFLYPNGGLRKTQSALRWTMYSAHMDVPITPALFPN